MDETGSGVPMVLDHAADVKILTPLCEVKRLQNEVDRLKRVVAGQRRRWKREKQSLLRERNVAQRKAAILDRLIKDGMLTKEQVSQAATGRRIRWPARDVARALGLRCISRKGFNYVSKVLRLPLPSASTLSRRTRSFQIAPGVMDAAASVLEATAQGMTPLERLCVVSFDEMALDSRICYDGSADQLLAASKLQVSSK